LFTVSGVFPTEQATIFIPKEDAHRITIHVAQSRHTIASLLKAWSNAIPG
jgi:hypothetical protein